MWLRPTVGSSFGCWIRVTADHIPRVTRVPVAGYDLRLIPSGGWLRVAAAVRGHKGQNSQKLMLWFFVLWKNALEQQFCGLIVTVSRCRGVLVTESWCASFLVLEYQCGGFLVLGSRCRGICVSTVLFSFSYWKTKSQAKYFELC